MSQETATPADASSVYQRVARVIEQIRPAVQSDGGDLELVEVTADGVARIRLHGACVGCPSSTMTLHDGVEKNVREKVPEVVAVEQVR
jgi:Fe-S cluster biogenesis protein NfuA